MLFNLNKDRMTRIPHQDSYKPWRAKLSDGEYYRAVDAINSYIDSQGEVFVSSHIPGPDWTDTPFQPLYIACNKNPDQAALFFGLLVWEAVMKRDDRWCFKPADKEADDVIGMTYFRVKFEGRDT